MTRNGLVVYDPNIPMTIRFNRKETVAILRVKQDWDKFDDHCEIVHIEVTPNCNRSCAYCYNPKNEAQLPIEDIQTIINHLKSYGVFQITFGGGEPFVREDIWSLALYARAMGINVCTTTNGDILADWCLRNPDCSDIGVFGQINVSYHGDDKFYKNLAAITPVCKKYGAKIGINFCCQDDYMPELETIAKHAQIHNAELLLLSYKAVRMPKEAPNGAAITLKAFELASRYRISTAVDGSCVRRCQASKKFCDVHANGDVSVCSFIRTPIGNALTDEFGKIWKGRPKLVKCPHFAGVTNANIITE
jgi:MoaA/NifB/PqqE/SkfB family radical SAM enzyme